MSYRLLIVDDEKLTRESLLQYIDWHPFGIEEVAVAGCGAQALKIMETTSIDILLTDVRMPKMDGITLAAQVRQLYPNCRIIFLSGYSDKQYLKSAIALKAECYIEKPICMEELAPVMQAIRQQLDAEQHSHKNEALLVSSLVNSLSLVAQEIALTLISVHCDYLALRQKYAPLYFTWEKTGQFSVLYLYPDSNLKQHQDDRHLVELMTQYLNSSAWPIPIDFFAAQETHGTVVLIINGMSRVQLLQSARLLQRYLLQKHIPTSVGISRICNNLEHIADAYNEAKAALEQRFYLGAGQITGADSLVPGADFSQELFSMPVVDLASATTLFDTLAQRRCQDIVAVKQAVYTLYCSMLERTLNKTGLARDEFFEKTLAEMRELVLYGMQALQTMGDDAHEPKIKSAIHYMLWNYSSPKLSVKVLANHVGLSQNYFCALFKQNTGSTVNDFLINIRIDKTKKLLRTTDLRLYEITERVGLTDPNYLSALFKRFCGQTPSQYRALAQRNRGDLR